MWSRRGGRVAQVGVVVGALGGVAEDFVGVLEDGVGFVGLGGAAGLVGVHLEGLLEEVGADLRLGGIGRDAEDLV